MAKVTSKLQVTLPKALADQYGLEPGDEIEFEPAGPVIRLIPPRTRRPKLDVVERMRLFDESTERQRQREARLDPPYPPHEDLVDRGWTREDLYGRGLTD